MARPQATAQLGYVPTPTPVIDSLRSLITIPPGCRVIDPCCGGGDMVRALAPKAKIYGIELERDRAAAAAGNLDVVINCAMQDAVVTPGSFGAMLLNPPYDHSTEGRLEGVFLRACSRYLAAAGVLVLIIPRYAMRQCASTLHYQFDVTKVWQFPDGWYDGPHMAFKQVVVVATKRAELQRKPYFELWDCQTYRKISTESWDALPDSFPVDSPDRLVAPIGSTPSVFRSGSITNDEYVAMLDQSPIYRAMDAHRSSRRVRPPLPLKQGHIALVLASGAVDGVYGEGDLLHVVKGTVERHESIERRPWRTPDNKPAVTEVKTHSFSIRLRAMTMDGSIHDMVAVGGPPDQDDADASEED